METTAGCPLHHPAALHSTNHSSTNPLGIAKIFPLKVISKVLRRQCPWSMIIRLLLQLLQLSFPAPDKSVCPAPVQLHCVVASPLRPQQLRGLAQDAPTPHPIPPLIWRGGCPSSAQLCPALPSSGGTHSDGAAAGRLGWGTPHSPAWVTRPETRPEHQPQISTQHLDIDIYTVSRYRYLHSI